MARSYLYVPWAMSLSYLLTLSGCASIATDSTQPITVTTTGCDNAKCEIKGDDVIYFVTTPGTVVVDKDDDDLVITCKHDDYSGVVVSGTLKSKAGGWVFGNILFGGVIGAGIDLISGNAYEYPNYLQVPMDCGDGRYLADTSENKIKFDSLEESNKKNLTSEAEGKPGTCDMVEVQPSIWETKCY
jgi:hypothetical protein